MNLTTTNEKHNQMEGSGEEKNECKVTWAKKKKKMTKYLCCQPKDKYIYI